MNVLYLLKILGTNKLSELVAAIDLPPLDMNLALWGAIEAGEIEVDEKNDRVKALTDEYESWHDQDLTRKLLAVIKHYAKNESNITVGRLSSYIKDPVKEHFGYPIHEYLMSMQYLIDNGQVIEKVVSVPEVKKKRPFHRFIFLCLPDNPNEEWNARAVNKWITDFENAKTKRKK